MLVNRFWDKYPLSVYAFNVFQYGRDWSSYNPRNAVCMKVDNEHLDQIFSKRFETAILMKTRRSPQPTAILAWSVKIKLIQEDKLGSTFKLVGVDISFNRTRYVVIDSILIFSIVYV